MLLVESELSRIQGVPADRSRNSEAARSTLRRGMHTIKHHIVPV